MKEGKEEDGFWEEDGGDDFFNDPIDDIGADSTENSEESEKNTSKEEDLNTKKEEDEDYEFFADSNPDYPEDDEDDEEGEDDNSTKKEKSSTKKKSKTTKVGVVDAVSFLKERNILDFELEEGTEMTEELAEEILENDIEDKIEARVEEHMGELPEEVKNLIRFTTKGGSFMEYVNTLKDNRTNNITRSIDLTEEANQILVTRNALTTEGYDNEYIESQLEFLKESGKLEAISKKHFKKWADRDDKVQAELVENKRKQVQAEKDRRKAHKAGVAQVVKSNKTIGDFKISPTDKRELPSYMADKSVETEAGTTLTPMYRDLYAALNDPNKAIMLAKILRNDFNFEGIKNSAVTDKTKEVKDKLRKTGKSTPSSSRKTAHKRKSLIDMIE